MNCQCNQEIYLNLKYNYNFCQVPESFNFDLNMVHQVMRLLHLQSHLDVIHLDELARQSQVCGDLK